ncbi:unnamed protein product [Amoebophrya sp. A120]|nr:unnamed protein product [Amoebophrya sp. A120]|eukprot:GSA120T00004375001.1
MLISLASICTSPCDCSGRELNKEKEMHPPHHVN